MTELPSRRDVPPPAPSIPPRPPCSNEFHSGQPDKQARKDRDCSGLDGSRGLCDCLGYGPDEHSVELCSAKFVVHESRHGHSVADELHWRDNGAPDDHRGGDEEDVLQDAAEGQDKAGGFPDLRVSSSRQLNQISFFSRFDLGLGDERVVENSPGRRLQRSAGMRRRRSQRSDAVPLSPVL